MGGGSSKAKSLKTEVAKDGRSTGQESTASASKKKNSKKKRSRPMDSVGDSNYVCDGTSNDYALLYVQPGSNMLVCLWLTVDQTSGETAITPGKHSKTIEIFERAANGGGTVEDVHFRETSAQEIAHECKGSRGIVLLCDAVTVEGQALMRFLWARNLWMRTQKSTIIMILPSCSADPNGPRTTHPSLFGTAFSVLTTINILGLEFGESFLKKGKLTKQQGGTKRSCEARGTRIAFCPRHVWYASQNYGQVGSKDYGTNLSLVKSILTRFHLRGKIRSALENPIGISTSDRTESQKDQDKDAAVELKRLQEEVLTLKHQNSLRRQASMAANSAMDDSASIQDARIDAKNSEDDLLSGFAMGIGVDGKKDNLASMKEMPSKVSQARHASLATAAARHRRAKLQESGSVPHMDDLDCETIYLEGTDPAFFDYFLSSSFEQLVLHNNAYFDGIPGMQQSNLEKAIGNLTALWKIVWKRSDLDGEVLGEDPAGYEDADTRVVPVGKPIGFSRAYCSTLPLGDVGTWPSGGLVVVGGGGDVSKHIVTSIAAIASPNVVVDSKPERRFTTLPENMNEMQAGIEADVMQFSLDDQDASLRVEKKASKAAFGTGGAGVGGVRHVLSYLTQLKDMPKHKPWTTGSCDALIVYDSADDPEQLVRFLKARHSAIAGIDEPPSVVLAMLIPEATGDSAQWERVAQVLAAEASFTCNLVLFLKSGDVIRGDMNVYVSFNIYCGPGGFSQGFCVEGDVEEAPRKVISQILGHTHPSAPIANAGYGISATPRGAKNSIWSVLAVVHTLILDIYMRALQAANETWDDDKMESLTALGTVRSKWIDNFTIKESGVV
eukprot:g988.t1